jgi:hypothetical protein
MIFREVSIFDGKGQRNGGVKVAILAAESYSREDTAEYREGLGRGDDHPTRGFRLGALSNTPATTPSPSSIMISVPIKSPSIGERIPTFFLAHCEFVLAAFEQQRRVTSAGWVDGDTGFRCATADNN